MATLDDKILGEKLHYYCSSSEDEDEDDSNSEKGESAQKSEPVQSSLPKPNKWEGTSTNTGPKGVIKDWQRFKQLEIEKREENEREKRELMKKLSMTVKSALEEEQMKADDDLDELLEDDDFLMAYRMNRMKEMLAQTEHNLKFGNLIYLNSGDEYLNAIDKEHKAVKIIIHIYENNNQACQIMNTCLVALSKAYKEVKFCCIIASHAGLSREFKSNGVPALLVYKAGMVVGNFVRLSDELGVEFDESDVQSFLVEHGMLEDKSLQPLAIRTGDTQDD